MNSKQCSLVFIYLQHGNVLCTRPITSSLLFVAFFCTVYILLSQFLCWEPILYRFTLDFVCMLYRSSYLLKTVAYCWVSLVSTDNTHSAQGLRADNMWFLGLEDPYEIYFINSFVIKVSWSQVWWIEEGECKNRNCNHSMCDQHKVCSVVLASWHVFYCWTLKNIQRAIFWCLASFNKFILRLVHLECIWTLFKRSRDVLDVFSSSWVWVLVAAPPPLLLPTSSVVQLSPT